MKTKHLVTLSAAALLLLAGCATQPAGPAPQDSTKFTVENTEKFVLLDKASQAGITCTGLQERTLPDGRIEVVANIKNRESHPLQIQVNCVFKDDQGFSTGDETAFQTVTIGRRDTEAVRFTAANDKAKKYTLRVREAK
ncbi:MAG TPA: YcfL family protein [Opitutaceae bacterium]|nr:YcfL family protein [Opitutaceae bacterium]HND62602.1 YcfL family protein [Opitutaceae bacterium]